MADDVMISDVPYSDAELMGMLKAADWLDSNGFDNAASALTHYVRSVVTEALATTRHE